MNSHIDAYRKELKTLTFNSKPIINVLTMLADDNRKEASKIIRQIENRIREVPSPIKLSLLYLLDSIIKNIKDDGKYIRIVEENIVDTFSHTFEKGNEKIRQSLFKLRNTWIRIIDKYVLKEIDESIRLLDPAWPIGKIDSSIYVNPYFILDSEKRGVHNGDQRDVDEKTQVKHKESKSTDTELSSMDSEIYEKQKRLDILLRTRDMKVVNMKSIPSIEMNNHHISEIKHKIPKIKEPDPKKRNVEKKIVEKPTTSQFTPFNNDELQKLKDLSNLLTIVQPKLSKTTFDNEDTPKNNDTHDYVDNQVIVTQAANVFDIDIDTFTPPGITRKIPPPPTQKYPNRIAHTFPFPNDSNLPINRRNASQFSRHGDVGSSSIFYQKPLYFPANEATNYNRPQIHYQHDYNKMKLQFDQKPLNNSKKPRSYQHGQFSNSNSFNSNHKNDKINNQVLSILQKAKLSGNMNKPVKDNINVPEVVNYLVRSGVIDPKMIKQNIFYEIPNLRDFYLPDFKRRYEPLITKLYSGSSCSSLCGRRFMLPAQKLIYEKHLDWHFRQNQLTIKQTYVTERELYICCDDWFVYEDDIYVDETTLKSDVFESKKNDLETLKKTVTSNCTEVSKLNDDNTCIVCQETFDVFYDQDEDIWKFKNCVKFDDKFFHPSCLDDYK
ncbi:hypothetical protein A3Q56_03903 [Intoshia linei]|uniref:CID domain-containing protein n=1 Tax=Intoshia linei TaxID=1819745 RepID=A0A177B2A5_9BILA|nr:hypothetical protein A3Q56_03903 [Intoshia linei]